MCKNDKVNRYKVICSLLFSCLVGGQSVSAQEPLAQKPSFIRTFQSKTIIPGARYVYLVQGKVVKHESVPERKGCFLSTLKIEHVYSGPPELLDSTFVVESQDANGPGDFHAPPVKPELEMGEVGIWPILWEDDELRFSSDSLDLSNFGVAFPARQNKVSKEQFALRRAVAEKIESLGQLSAKEQLASIEKWMSETADPTYNYSFSLGRRVLEEQKDPSIKAFLRTLLLDKNLSVVKQILLDDTLRMVDEVAWSGSPEQTKLWHSWFNGTDESTKLSALDHIIMYRGTGAGVVTDILNAILDSDKDSASLKKEAIRLLSILPRRQIATQTAIFDRLLQQVKLNKSPALQLSSAKCLVNLQPFSEQQLGQINAIIEAQPNSEVASALKQNLKKVNPWGAW